MRDVLRIGTLVVLASTSVPAQIPGPSPAPALAASPLTRTISYTDARVALEALHDRLPPELRGKPPADLESDWPVWVANRDAAIRARVSRGDEDSLVNLWLFGTSFTALPPARPAALAAHSGIAAEVIDRRLEDLLTALESPRTNERLRFARHFFDTRGIDPATSKGKADIRLFLADARQRMLAEDADYSRALEAAKAVGDPIAEVTAYASIYRERGLSSDTSILSSFGVDAALEALVDAAMLGARQIRRVAIIGPGLDFINKANGHDFYPEQTIQPFAVIDSLLRLGLSQPDALSVTTFDLSARVNQHVAAARDRAREGHSYVLQLPLTGSERWSPALVRYWARVGGQIGEDVKASGVPPTAGAVKVRATRVRPDIVLCVTPRDLNIVVERLEPLADEQRFDLVVATNVFVYYGAFEQSLAIANVASMLRSGGSLLSNQAVLPVGPMRPSVGHTSVAYSDRQQDNMFWYQRQ